MTKKEALDLAIVGLVDMSWDVYLSFSRKQQPSNDVIMEAIAVLEEMKDDEERSD